MDVQVAICGPICCLPICFDNPVFKKNAKFTDLLSSVVMLCVVFPCIDYSRSGVL